MKIKLLLLALVTAICLQACTFAKISSKGSIPIFMNQPTDDMELIEHVTVEKFVNFDYSGAYDAGKLLEKEISEKKPDAIANLTIEFKVTFKSYLINTITCGFARAHVVKVDADFLQYSDPNNPKKKKRGKK